MTKNKQNGRMMQKPNWITFTGVDAYTDLYRLIAISDKYKGFVEWGVLFSENQVKKGNLRYPPRLLTEALRPLTYLNMAAHLCGKYATEANKGIVPDCDFTALNFRRVQVNHNNPDIAKLNDFSREVHKQVIAQSRDPEGFAMGGDVQWLFDQSGGRGERPEKLPKNMAPVMCGYAGGINPDNVLDVISDIEAELYWIDMETGVRNEHDLFDLDKCEAVLKAVYEDS